MPSTQYMASLSAALASSSGHDAPHSAPNPTMSNYAEVDCGWLSPKFCVYPQELIFELKHHSSLSLIRLLSHSFMISSRIEILVGNGKTLDDAKFRKLGFMKLDENSRSGYKARELKEVKLNATGSFLKVVCHQNHENEHNLCQQVGIVGLEFIGQYTGKDQAMGRDTGYGNVIDLLSPRVPPVPPPLGGGSGAVTVNDLERHMARGDPDSIMWRSIRAVTEAKDAAIANQDYVRCKQIKPVEKELQSSAIQYHDLSNAKDEAVLSEDYDRANILKAEMDGLKERASNVLTGLGIVLPSPKPVNPPSPTPEDEPETALEDAGPPSPVNDVPEEDFSLKTLLEEVESDTMLAEDVKEPNQPPSPRLENLLETAKIQSPRQKVRGDADLDVAAPEVEGSPQHDKKTEQDDEKAAVDIPLDTPVDVPDDAIEDSSANADQLDVAEVLQAKEYIDNQNSEEISPRVAELPREPSPPPEVWEEEDVPRGASPPRSPTPPPPIVPDGQEIQNEMEEWEEAKREVTIRSRQRRQREKETNENHFMSQEESEMLSYNEAIERLGLEKFSSIAIQRTARGKQGRNVANDKRIEKQTKTIIKIQAIIRGALSRAFVNKKRGVRKRTKNAFKRGMGLLKASKLFKAEGKDRRLRLDALQDEEEDRKVAEGMQEEKKEEGGASADPAASAPEPQAPPAPEEVLEHLDALIDDPDVLKKALAAAQTFGLADLQRIHSKDYKYRENGFHNIALNLGSLVEADGGGLEKMLVPLSDVLVVGMDDKVAESFYAALNIVEALEELVKSSSDNVKLSEDKVDDVSGAIPADANANAETSAEASTTKEIVAPPSEPPVLVPKLTRDVFCPIIESSVRSMVARLGDVNSGIAEASFQALSQIGAWDCCGPAFVAQVALKRLFRWEEQMTRPVANRLLLLNQLLHTATGSQTAGAAVLAAASLKFANDCGAFESTNDKVNVAAKELEETALKMMGDNAKLLIGDLKGVSLLAELQRAERQRHVKLEKLVEKSKTLTLDMEHIGEAVEKTILDVNDSVSKVEEDVDSVFDSMVAKLNERRSQVKKHLKDIGDGKTGALESQKKDIEKLRTGLDETGRMAGDALNMLHKEEYNALIEPLTKHLESLGAEHAKMQRESCDNSVIAFVVGGTEKVVDSIVENMGAIHTSSDVLPGFQKLAGDFGDGLERSPVKPRRKGAAGDVVAKVEEGEGDENQLAINKDIHLTVRALVPRQGLEGVDEYHKAPPRETVVVEVRKGSPELLAKEGHEGEILGRVIIVNQIESPPRDDYSVSQYFESLYTQAEIQELPNGWHDSDQKLIEKRRSVVTHRSVPTTRISKVVKFAGDSVWAKKLRKEASENSAYSIDWKKDMREIDAALWEEK